MKYKWLNKIKWQDELKGDYLLIAETVGIDGFIKLMEFFEKTPIYFSTSVFEKLLERYIAQSPDTAVKELARETGKSERSIRRLKNQVK
jgi:hypothetical protein